MNATYVSRVLRLTLLAPEILDAILDGRKQEGRGLDLLLAVLPVDWTGSMMRYWDGRPTSAH